MRRLALSALFFLLFSPLLAVAQPALKATGELVFDTETLKPGQQAIAAAVITIQEHYHAQSSQPLDELLIPFSAKLTADGPVTIDEPLYAPGKILDLPALGGKLSVYEGQVLAFIPFTVPADAKPGTLNFTAKVKMQICDDQTCDPPGTLTLKKAIQVGVSDAPTRSTRREIFSQFDPLTYQNKHAAATASPTATTTLSTAPSTNWIHYSDAEFARLRALGVPFIVKFTAAWCVNCHVVERRVFGDAATLEELVRQGVYLVKVDLTEDGAPGSELLAQLNPSRSIPFTAVYFPGKAEPAKLTGIYSSADLLGTLKDAGKTTTSTTAVLGYELRDAPLVMKLLVAIGVGLLLNAVPCVLPVLPLKAMSFYEDANRSRSRSILNGLLFSAGVVTTFGGLALFVISQNALWGKFISHPITAVALAVILLLAAAQAFGLFEIVLPRAVTNLERYTDASAFSGGSVLNQAEPNVALKLLTNFLSGILIAVLSTPCTIGIFAAVIAIAIAAGSAIGSLILCFVGVGMALPWFALSALPEVTQRFPRTGPWPLVVKQMTAFLLIATAVFFAAPLMPASFRERGLWWLIFACIAASAVFLVGRTIQIAPRPRPIAISSGVGAVIVAVGLFLTFFFIG